MKPLTKRILNMVLIFGTLALVIVIGLRDNDLPTTLQTLARMDLPNVLACLGCFFCFLLTEALSIRYFLWRQGYQITTGYGLFVTITGQYYSAITPGASGGQPMQVYYLHRRHVSTGVATSALVTRFFCFQFMLSLLTTVFWIAYGPFVQEQVGGSMWVLIVGYVYNIFTCTLVILFALMRPLVRWIVGLVLKLGRWLRLVKDPEASRDRWMKAVDVFHDSIHQIMRHPVDLLVQMLLGAVQLLALMSVCWFVYRGLNLSGYTWGQTVTMGMMEYISAAYTPLPGASGAQEAVFSIYFSRIFPGSNMLAAILLWRFFTYYVAILIGAVVVTTAGLRQGRSLREMAQMGSTPPAMETDAAAASPAAAPSSPSASPEDPPGA